MNESTSRATPGLDGVLTEQKRVENALRESEERISKLIALMPAAVYTCDAEGRLTFYNRRAAELWGREPRLGEEQEKFCGSFRMWTPDGLLLRHEHCPMAQAVREGSSARNLEVVIERPTGSRVVASVNIDPLYDREGRLVGAINVFEDITERKRAEEALRVVDRAKDEFLAMLGHELRNPLMPLLGVVEMLGRRAHDGGELERAHALMERQVGHLTRLVDDLLDVSRITRGLVELRKEPVNLAEAAQQAVEMVTPAIDRRGHDLSVALPRKPLSVEGDATRLTQVIVNLLNNAAKYTDPGGKIWLRVEREDGQALVQVRDNGSGMRAELIPKVFDLFAQGERTLDRAQGGLGLGLTLVKRLVELHGGTVEARSEGLGKGSEFVVRLPPCKEEGGLSKHEKDGASAADSSFVLYPSSLKVLVVDDSEDVAESLVWMLDGLAKDVKMVHSGAAALETAREWHPDIVLCDLGMPGMDGYETCRRLRQLPGLKKVVIAAVSGYGGPEDRRKSQEAGFNWHLVKPIGRATLEELLKSAAGA